jgi:hypothetical protein
MTRKSAQSLNRREILRLLGTAGVGSAFAMEQLVGVPGIMSGVGSLMNLGSRPHPYDTYGLLADAARGGSSLFTVNKAMAQASESWTLVQIKVCNHVFTPLVFKLGKREGDAVNTDTSVKPASDKMGTAKPTIESLGVNELTDIPRFQQLRLNKWFARILQKGTADGGAPTESNLLGLKSTDVGELSDGTVAVQAFLGLAQNEVNNHALKGCKLRSGLPDLTLFAQESGIITSPLGVTCFMMGVNYDKAEGALPVNGVLGAESAETAIITSRSVSEYVSQIQQFVGPGYVDRSGIEQNITYKLDRIVSDQADLRRELIGSIGKFREGIEGLKRAGALESTVQALSADTGNGQAIGKTQRGASSEFLGQCLYVANSVDLPSQPVRNYSLFLNISDLDGQNLNVGYFGGGTGDVRAYSYIEGMRQLAMGLNVIGKKIAEGRKIIVVVSSEGGRGTNMEDAKTSFALVMGPKGAGLLDDKLFWNEEAMNVLSNATIQNPALAASASPWTVDGLKNADGTALSSVPTTGDVQMGVVEFLEGVSGVNARKNLSSGDARFVKLARKS